MTVAKTQVRLVQSPRRAIAQNSYLKFRKHVIRRAETAATRPKMHMKKQEGGLQSASVPRH
jgi:hypothetical protein